MRGLLPDMIYDIFLNTAIEYSIAAGFRQSGLAVLFCCQWLLPDMMTNQ
jgi:hypothetical protein